MCWFPPLVHLICRKAALLRVQLRHFATLSQDFCSILASFTRKCMKTDVGGINWEILMVLRKQTLDLR